MAWHFNWRFTNIRASAYAQTSLQFTEAKLLYSQMSFTQKERHESTHATEVLSSIGRDNHPTDNIVREDNYIIALVNIPLIKLDPWRRRTCGCRLRKEMPFTVRTAFSSPVFKCFIAWVLPRICVSLLLSTGTMYPIAVFDRYLSPTCIRHRQYRYWGRQRLRTVDWAHPEIGEYTCELDMPSFEVKRNTHMLYGRH